MTYGRLQCRLRARKQGLQQESRQGPDDTLVGLGTTMVTVHSAPHLWHPSPAPHSLLAQLAKKQLAQLVGEQQDS